MKWRPSFQQRAQHMVILGGCIVCFLPGAWGLLGLWMVGSGGHCAHFWGRAAEVSCPDWSQEGLWSHLELSVLLVNKAGPGKEQVLG